MENIIGTVISVKQQWWLKINTKPVRSHSLDGAIFPHIIKASFNVNGNEYIATKWIKAKLTPPAVGDKVNIAYNPEKPSKAEIQI